MKNLKLLNINKYTFEIETIENDFEDVLYAKLG